MNSRAQLSASVPQAWARLRCSLDRYLRDPEGRSLVARAYRAAKASHQGQLRASGHEYLIHPLEVAGILAELRLDPKALAAALLHDVLEDSSLDRRRLEAEFGREVAELVEGVTKLSAVSLPPPEQTRAASLAAHHQAENLRKLFLAMARDLRVIFIRLADRLHNMRTVSFLPPERRLAMARETMDLYAALAGRLGLWEFKWRLEDLAFSVLEPKRYRELERQMAERLRRRRRTLLSFKRSVARYLRQEGLSVVSVEGRTKHVYSIHAKMLRKGCGLDDILDLLAVRVIVPEVADCYRAFGLIQNLWMPVPGRFKDHIAMPKPNGYRSLHTTVLGPDGFPVEIQIRTPEMHRVNEFGVAAHWAYKESPGRDDPRSRELYAWVRRLLEWFEEGRGEPDYLQNLKLDILSHQVFVFTPKGEVVDLPSGSTPLDFAYRIHTQIGHRFIGARVNSRIVPIDYRLKNADIVDVLTSNRDNPSWDWLKVVRSRHARNKIRQWFRRERRAESIQRGRELLQQEMEKKGLRLNLKQEDLLKPLWQRSHNSLDELYASLGSGESSPSLMAKKLFKTLPSEYLPRKREVLTTKRPEIAPPIPVSVPGLSGISLRLARCCNPEKGTEITGYVSQGRMTVHRRDCPNFKRLSENRDRVVRVRWIDRE
jgi:GTP pyrophosphokinase